MNQTIDQKPEDMTIREILENLALDIGKQVTREYVGKHGLYEGLSTSNVRAIDIAEERLQQVIKEKSCLVSH